MRRKFENAATGSWKAITPKREKTQSSVVTAHSRETFSQPLHDSTRARLAHRGHAGSLRVTQLEGTGAASPDYGGSLSPKGVRPHQNRS